MRTVTISLLATALLLTVAVTTYADTRYISDQLVVTVRSNKTKIYTVLATLRTANPVEVLEEDANFLKIRTAKGVVGFIRKQYVTRTIPKAIQIAQLKKQQATLKKQLQQQQLKVQKTSGVATASQSEIEQLTNDLKQTRQQLEKVSRDYEQLKKRSENVINLTTERDQLREENARITSQLTVLQEENKGFHRSNMIQWFLAGGGVFLVGWLIGKISRKKRGYGRF